MADSASNVKLKDASVSILNAKDSTLVSFTRAAENGSFSIGKLNKGKFLLLITYPEYADYVEEFSLDSAKTEHNFKQLNMLLKSKLLAEVLIKGTAAAIKIKGDTTEYNAAAFKIQPNSKVEDLLKQLPGIQVDKDGKITAQGQAVNKVLVDGEEFFGDDPTLVTKNIRGDMVDKVQLYDKKSDQATFTGIDDGEKTKTINIKLKEDKKSGYFGKVDAGIGTKDFYQGQALFNKFKAKQKFSAYGTSSNTGKTGLGWEDSNKYGGGSDGMQFVDDGIMYFGGGGDDLDSFDGRYNGQGIPKAHTGGLHYDSKWNDDKNSINTNYKIGSLAVDGSTNTLSQNTLPTGIIKSNSDQIFNNSIFRQKLDATYQIKLDSTSNLKLTVDGTVKNSETNSDYTSETRNGNDELRNDNTRRLTNKVDGRILNMSAFYTKKFKKAGRTLSVNLAEAFNQSNAKGFLQSNTNLYDSTGVISNQKIDQYKTNDTKSSVLSSNIAYTEPFTKAFSVILNYGFGINNSTADRKSFDQSAPGNYNLLNDSLSNDFKLNQFSNQVGAIFNYKKEKHVINFGTKVSDVSFKQVNLYTDDIFKRHFTNWNPQASYQYRFTQQKSFRFNYYGNTTQPTIDQIQPVRVNTDPLNITLGNPDLTPSFNHRFNLGYNSYKVLSGQSIWLSGSYSFTTNPIVSNTFTDSTGRSTYQSFNLSGKKPNNFYANAYFDQKISKGDFNIGLNMSANGNTYYNMINNELNSTKSYTYSAGVSLSKYKQKKYDFWMNFRPNYTKSTSSYMTNGELRKNINDGKGFNANASFNIYLPGKLQISSDGNYEYKAKTQSFPDDFSQFIWNASIVKTFLKEDNLKVSLTGNDLLNKNAGFTRNTTANSFYQNSYTSIRRYFMLSVVYDFNKMGGGVKTSK
ncbi:TonB-dependent receptor [Mucilaginibacter gynuensis]|uniref:TonB-dependent receptor n=1 Tax=Mucilaginibacter gynuensis TaxID=1302236 RepID=A0ABP8HGW2_9SPHI